MFLKCTTLKFVKKRPLNVRKMRLLNVRKMRLLNVRKMRLLNVYIVGGKRQMNYKFIPTDLFRGCPLIRRLYI